MQALFHRPPAVAKHPSLDSLYKAPQRIVLQVVATPTKHIPGRKKSLEKENVMNAAAMDTQMGANRMNSRYRKHS